MSNGESNASVRRVTTGLSELSKEPWRGSSELRASRRPKTKREQAANAPHPQPSQQGPEGTSTIISRTSIPFAKIKEEDSQVVAEAGQVRAASVRDIFDYFLIALN